MFGGDKIVKRIFSVIISALLVCIMMFAIPGAHAAERDSNEVAVTAGDRVRYCVYVQASDNTLSGVNLTVNYDTDCLEIAYEGQTKLAEMTDLPNGVLNADESGTGAIIATYADGIKGTDLSDGVQVLDVEFNAVKDSVTSVSYYMEELFDFSGEEVEYIDKSNVYSNIFVNGQPFGKEPIPAESSEGQEELTETNSRSEAASTVTACIIIAVIAAVAVVMVIFFIKLNAERKKDKKKSNVKKK